MHAGRRSSNAAHFEPMALATGDDEVDSPVQYRRLAPCRSLHPSEPLLGAFLKSRKRRRNHEEHEGHEEVKERNVGCRLSSALR